MFVEVALLAWSALALLWWGIACGLVWAGEAKTIREEASCEADAATTLTVFKPLAPLGRSGFDPRGIASFLSQLEDRDELLVGAHESDCVRLERALAELSARFSSSSMRIIWRSEPDALANPKVAWLQILAPHARGELWLWSDADIVAPPDFLRAARSEYRAGGAKLITWPYVVREIATAPALLDALFVNAEFFPGVLLLRRLGPVDFGLGAGLLFARADLEAAVSWDDLGAALADDFLLAQRLRPVRVGQAVLSTQADEATWRAAILHYLRWSKTVRWNRPGGTAARIIVLPLLGWFALVLTKPGLFFGWLGLLGTMQMDVVAALLIMRRVGCGSRLRDLAVLEFWSLGRVLVWLACWLPWPVTWRGQRWWGPFQRPVGRR
jgi:ceramide glucosyltransferase